MGYDEADERTVELIHKLYRLGLIDFPEEAWQEREGTHMSWWSETNIVYGVIYDTIKRLVNTKNFYSNRVSMAHMRGDYQV